MDEIKSNSNKIDPVTIKGTFVILLATLLLSTVVIPLAIAAVAPKLTPYTAEFPGKNTLENYHGNLHPTVTAFAPFKDKLGISWDDDYLYIEGNGLPDHSMMRGITAWQQQIPIPHDFTGQNRFKLPLKPQLLDKPGDLTLMGPIAIAVNGIPIFHALTQSGKDAYAGGELDQWGGHCGRADDYHYHIAPSHLEKIVGKGNPVAFGLDGYPVYLENPAKDKPLDESHGYFDDDGNYRYIGNLKPPYMMSYFKGAADLEDRPPTRGVRPFLRPLRGAKITGFSGSLADGYSLEYENSGQKSYVNYTIKENGGVDFEFVDSSGNKTEESHERRTGGGGGKGNSNGRKGGEKGKGKGKGKGMPRPQQPEEPAGPRPPASPDPLVDALDVNKDGTIDASELDVATSLLRALDRDGDGKLSREEATGRKGGSKGRSKR